MAEWSMAAVLKTVVQQCTRGSNPLPSANRWKPTLSAFVVSGPSGKFTFRVAPTQQKQPCESHGCFHPILQSPAQRDRDVAAQRAGKSRKQSPAQRDRECAGSLLPSTIPPGNAQPACGRAQSRQIETRPSREEYEIFRDDHAQKDFGLCLRQ